MMQKPCHTTTWLMRLAMEMLTHLYECLIKCACVSSEGFKNMIRKEKVR